VEREGKDVLPVLRHDAQHDDVDDQELALPIGRRVHVAGDEWEECRAVLLWLECTPARRIAV
jgi:hypothetical protein